MVGIELSQSQAGQLKLEFEEGVLGKVPHFEREKNCTLTCNGIQVYLTNSISSTVHHTATAVVPCLLIDMDGIHIPQHSQQTGQSNVELDQRQLQVEFIRKFRKLLR